MYVDAGAEAIRRDPAGFARLQWETWSPPGWYDDVRRRLADVERLAVPTLMVQGGADFCDPPDLTADDARSFTGPYERVVLDDVGHFPHREAPDAVTNLLARHLD